LIYQEKNNVCVSTVCNIFINKYGKDAHMARVKRLKDIRIKRIFKALEKAGKLGSKPEREFYKKINSKLNINVKHHDYDLIPPFEIDITIPKYKIAIFWDGIGHYKPIFGENIFKQVVYRDKFKRKKT